MRPSARRFAVLLLWQFATCIVGLPFYFAIAVLTLDQTWPSRLTATGMILALLVAIFVFRNPLTAFIDKAALAAPDGAPARRASGLRLDRHLELYLLGCLLVIPMALHLSRDWIEVSGVGAGLLAYLICWHLCLVFPAMLWARAKSTEPLPPKHSSDGIAELAVLAVAPPGEGDGPITVTVRVDRTLSLRAVVAAVLRRQVLPTISGGKRQWTIMIEGVPVAVVTQTWEHPRWWPPVDWIGDPEEPFPADDTLRMRIEQGTPA
jgi:hypothetical protein